MRIDTPTGRFYRVTTDDGEEALYPSVTTVLSVIAKDLVPWALRECTTFLRKNIPLSGVPTQTGVDNLLTAAMRQPAERLAEACAFGSDAHEYAARYITAGVMPALAGIGPRMASWLARFKQWWDRSGFECLLSEEIVWSHRYCYAGTLDAFCKDAAGRLYLVDFKSSNTLHAGGEYVLQSVAYKMALLEQSTRLLPEWADQIADADTLIVRIGKKDESVDILHVDAQNHDAYFLAFTAARALFDWQMDSARIVEKGLRSYQEQQEVGGISR